MKAIFRKLLIFQFNNCFQVRINNCNNVHMSFCNYSIIIIMLFIFAIFSSCSKKSSNSVVDVKSASIVGTWCATRIDGAIDANGNPLVITCDVSTWIFKGDGTYSWFLHAPPYYNLDYTGTYKYENEKITLTGPVAQLPADGYIQCSKGSSTFTFLDSDSDRWIYELNN